MKITVILLTLLLSLFAAISFAGTGIEQKATTTLIIKEESFMVNGKKSKTFRIVQPDGTWGYQGTKGEVFKAVVKNETSEPVTVHWHGLILPNKEDGAPYVTQLPMPPGGAYPYQFKLVQEGTFWVHEHHGLRLQQQLAAPFIIKSKEAKNEKDVIIFLSDFSYIDPRVIFQNLQKGMMDHGHAMAMQHQSHHNAKAPDLNDVNYDAYLTNYRTLQDPQIIAVKPGEMIRLRFINGSAATNFFVNTGLLPGQAIAVDGEDIDTLAGHQFQLATAQRIDVLVKIPEGEGAYPILAQGEGTAMQTGLILATPQAVIAPLSEKTTQTAGALDYQQEFKLKARHPLAVKKPGQILTLNLNGNMMDYRWTLNDHAWPNIAPLIVKPNKRVELVINNQTDMAHPMHLHGHTFEITQINGKPLDRGAMRDTVLVLPHTIVKVQFDSNNPGNWMLHCHMLYHAESGMMTLLSYDGIKLPEHLH